MIGAFYEGAQYSHKELVSARDPWSGNIHYDAALYVMQHFTQFARTGWENDTNTAGIWRTVPEASYSGVSGTENVDGSNGAPSYMTLADPRKRDFSTIAVNDSDRTKSYRIKAENMDLGDDATLEVWETRAADPGQAYDANFKHLAAEIRPDGDGYYTYQVEPRSIVTFTTLDRSHDKATKQRLPGSAARTVLDTDASGKRHDTRDSVLYADDFGYREEGRVRVGTDNGARTVSRSYLDSRGNQPRYLVDQTGAWEVGKDAGGDNVLYQYLDQSMKDTGAWNRNTPNTTVGDFRWENYRASVDVSFPDPQGGLATLGVRQQKGMAATDAAYSVGIGPSGNWTFYRYGTVIRTGTVPASDGYRLAVEAKEPTSPSPSTDRPSPTTRTRHAATGGRVKLGTDFHKVAFDNLKVEKVAGYTPYSRHAHRQHGRLGGLRRHVEPERLARGRDELVPVDVDRYHRRCDGHRPVLRDGHRRHRRQRRQCRPRRRRGRAADRAGRQDGRHGQAPGDLLAPRPAGGPAHGDVHPEVREARPRRLHRALGRRGRPGRHHRAARRSGRGGIPGPVRLDGGLLGRLQRHPLGGQGGRGRAARPRHPRRGPAREQTHRRVRGVGAQGGLTGAGCPPAAR